MNERIKELRMKVDMDMHLHNLEDIKAMEGCFGQEGGNKIVNEYIEKFAELIVKECGNWVNSRLVVEPDYGMEHRIERNRAVVGVMREFNQHFGVEE
jgi:hypothetical protein